MREGRGYWSHGIPPWLEWGASSSGAPSPALPSPQCHSPGTEPTGSMVTRTEASKGTEPPTTRHTYSPESTGDTWCSLSNEPWVWPEWR